MMFIKLLQFDFWANQSLLRCLQEPKHNEAIRLMAHIVGAQYVWLGRIIEKAVSYDYIWPEWSLVAIQARLDEIEPRWFSCLSALADLKATCTYQNSKGQDFETRIEDILTQVICRGAHHRGQVTHLIRAQEDEPINVDCITYMRQADNPYIKPSQ